MAPMIMSSQHPSPESPFRPWYRHGWVWFLIAIPLTSVIAGVAMLVIATRTADSLVADDYYKEGRAINQRLERDEEAVRLGIEIRPTLRASASGTLRIDVRFSSRLATPPQALRLRMSHPTLNELDVRATLLRSGEGRYQTEIPMPAPGRWHIQLEDDSATWRHKSIWTVEPTQ